MTLGHLETCHDHHSFGERIHHHPLKHVNYLAHFLNFSSLTCFAYIIKLEMSISFTSIMVLHSLDTKSDTSCMNLLFLACGSATMNGAYLESFVNLRGYSLTLMCPWFKFMNSCTFDSLSSIGKNLSKSAYLNSPHLLGPLLYPFH